ncbi:hypothetical protein CPC08DRAFT_785961 [Agrocybe pediades]|nr:hypothetical protein CPC08DRAFT_785961 [Agrocybe pediades]
MKLYLSTVLCSLYILAAHSALASPADPAPAQACGDPRHLVPFYRLYNPNIKDSFYTTGVDEKIQAIANLGYVEEGKQTVPLYRLYNGNVGVWDHLYTTSAQERASVITNPQYADEGIAGYVYQDELCNGLPLNRLYSDKAKNHFYTMDAAERDSTIANDADKYVSEGIIAYMFRF